MKINELKTEFITEGEVPLDYYPRPTLVRNVDKFKYLNLNGNWDFAKKRIKKYQGEKIENISFIQNIIVPYPVESKLSKVCIIPKKDDILIYQREFLYDLANITNQENHVLLHIDAADQETFVYLNDCFVGSFVGGYLRQTYDLTAYLKEKNTITIYVRDNLNKNYPYGKQSSSPKGIWYTKVSGIWKHVWLEEVPDNYIESIAITANIDNGEVKLSLNRKKEEITTVKIYNNNKLIKEMVTFDTNIINFKLEDPLLWSPESPNLYDVHIISQTDDIKTYFAYRKISIGKYNGYDVFYLNNKPYYMHGLLDQGYYPEGIYTPKSKQEYENDILVAKKLGFNTLRKHIKVEQDMWYYLCDKIGMLVWQDAVNSFPYRFITNSALPMLGLKKLNIKKHYASSTKQFYILHTETMVESLKNHPSIVLWTIFNEGWGQFDTEKVYNCVKYIDDTRIIDVASGWFKNTKINEVESLHVYFKPLKCKFKTDKPTIISEFGGYALNIKDHTYAKKAFGYKKIKTIDKFNEEFLKLYERDIINNIHKGLCASVYTQLTDVETEINGIMTYDRKVIKLDEKVANNIKQRLKY